MKNSKEYPVDRHTQMRISKARLKQVSAKVLLQYAERAGYYISF